MTKPLQGAFPHDVDLLVALKTLLDKFWGGCSELRLRIDEVPTKYLLSAARNTAVPVRRGLAFAHDIDSEDSDTTTEWLELQAGSRDRERNALLWISRINESCGT